MKKLTFFFALVFVANAHSQIVEISSPNNYTNSLRGYIGEPIVVDSNLFLRYQDNNENFVLFKHGGTGLTPIPSPNGYTASQKGYLGQPITMNEDLYLWYHGDDEGGIGFFNSMPGIEHVWGFIGQDAEMVECINWIDSVCAASTDSTTTTINNDLSQNFKLSTVPNQLNIHSSIESTIEVNIYNINGQYVYKNTHQSNLIEVNTSSFTNGTYIVEILSDQQIVARNKVIITN